VQAVEIQAFGGLDQEIDVSLTVYCTYQLAGYATHIEALFWTRLTAILAVDIHNLRIRNVDPRSATYTDIPLSTPWTWKGQAGDTTAVRYPEQLESDPQDRRRPGQL